MIYFLMPVIRPGNAQLFNSRSCSSLNAEVNKKWGKIDILTKKRLENYFMKVFWACMNWNFHARRFATNFEYELHLFKAKKIN